MAAEIPDLVAAARTGTGKGAARQARRDNRVPGIVYGGGIDPLPINIPLNELTKKLKQGRFLSTLFNLKVDGHDDVRVICRHVQRDTVKGMPIHFDLMRLRRMTRVKLFIPVTFEGEEESPGLKRGGVLTVVRPEVELWVIAGEIPESLTVDVSELDINDVVTISQISLPEGTRTTVDRDFVIANISAPSSLRSEEEEEADGEEDGEEVAADEVPTTADEAKAEESEQDE